MTKILVISHKHGLAPFAWRLKNERNEAGDLVNDVEIMVGRDRYERAWSGRLGKIIAADDKKRANLEPTLEAARAGDVVVLTDSEKWTSIFAEAGAKFLFGLGRRPAGLLPPVRVCSWFDGEAHSARCLLVADLGLFPGGFGAAIEAGLTLVAPLSWPEAFEAVLAGTTDELKAGGFRGLVQVGLKANEAGDSLVAVDWEAGWPWLASHAFIAQQDSFSAVLGGSEPAYPSRFTVVLSVTQPPWPKPSSRGFPQIAVGLPEDATARQELTRQVFFHDVAVEGNEVRTAGLDGLVAVPRGSGFTLGAARAKALQTALALGVPERQLRVDVGGSVDRVLTALETTGILL